MALATGDDLLVCLEHCRLLGAEQLQNVAQQVKRGMAPDAILDWLGQHGDLTAWQAAELRAGRTSFMVGKYKLLDQIGTGGMGEVYRAEHSVMGRHVALKLLSRTRLDNPTAVARFRREVKAAAKLDHPNIVTAHDAGQSGQHHYLVMEYIPGHDLASYAKKVGRLPVAWACEFIRQAADGLEHASAQGLVHRDIKPANLLVCWPADRALPIVKILDLGLARFSLDVVDDRLTARSVARNAARVAGVEVRDDVGATTMETVTVEGNIVGTPDYLSPEQIRGQGRVDIRSDIFSLGCTLFKLLSGQLPFVGKTLVEKVQARVSPGAPPPAPLRAFLPDAPAGLEAVLSRMIAARPEDRYESPHEVAQALLRYSVSMYVDPQIKLGRQRSTRLLQARASFAELKPLPDWPLPADLPPEPVAQPFPSAAPVPTASSSVVMPPLVVQAPEIVTNRPRTRRRGPELLALGIFLVAMATGLGLFIAFEPWREPGRVDAATVSDSESPRPRPIFHWSPSSAEGPGRLQGSGGAALSRRGMVLPGKEGRVVAPDVGPALTEACRASDEFSLVVKFRTGEEHQSGPARIVSLSSTGTSRNFTLGQERDDLVFRLRTSETDDNGMKSQVKLGPVFGDWMHVAVTYRSGSLSYYLNGKLVESWDKVQGSLDNWSDQMFILGNEYKDSRPWKGIVADVAVYDTVLDADTVAELASQAPR
jgi:serine/threonine protein kinase